jgi:hypothetical protein
MDSHRHTADAGIVWEPCGSCWGQRVIWGRRPGGGPLRSRPCEACLGIGARAVLTPAPRTVPIR